MKDTVKLRKDNRMGYHIPQEAIDEYRKWPIEQRLQWLYMGNLLRMGYSKRVIELHAKFREGKR